MRGLVLQEKGGSRRKFLMGFGACVCLILLVGFWREEERIEMFAEWEEGEVLDVVVACPISYKIATIALLNSLHANSHSDSIRVWMFEQQGEEGETAEALSSPDSHFPRKNIKILNYADKEDLTRLLPIIEQKHLEERQNKTNLGLIQAPPYSPEELHRIHKLSTDQHNYIRYYIPSIIDSLAPSTFSENENGNLELFAQKPKQFLYLDCDMIVKRDPMLLMREVSHRLGAEKGVCLAAGEREDPPLIDSLGPEDESQMILQELGIPPEMKSSFNAGMLVVDVDCWIKRNVLKNILQWLTIRTTRPIYRLGSQPPLLLSFVPEHTKVIQTHQSHLYPPLLKYTVVGEEWDTQARNCVDKWNSRKVGIVHYTGKNKPWQVIIDNKYQQNLWEQYGPKSLLPSDRMIVPAEESREEKEARREKEQQAEIEKFGRVLTFKEKEEFRKTRAQEKEERQKQRELEREMRREEKEKLREEMRKEKERKESEKIAEREKLAEQKLREREEKERERNLLMMEKERKGQEKEAERQIKIMMKEEKEMQKEAELFQRVLTNSLQKEQRGEQKELEWESWKVGRVKARMERRAENKKEIEKWYDSKFHAKFKKMMKMKVNVIQELRK